MTFTKNADAVFDGSNGRQVVNSEAQTWGMEVESKLGSADLETRSGITLKEVLSSGVATYGYTSLGDSPPALYEKLSTAPTTSDLRHVQDSEGAWFQLENAQDIRNYGAVAGSSNDIAPIIQLLFDLGINPIITGGVYTWSTQVDVPEGKRLAIYSDPSAKISTSSDIILLSVSRTTESNTSRTTLTLDNCWFEQTGTAKTGVVCKVVGPNSTYDDNSVFVRGEDSFYSNFNHVFEVNCASLRVSDARFTFNSVCAFLEYNASFSKFNNIIASNGDYFIYGDSELNKPTGAGSYDGVSNSIHIDGCTAVNNAITDIFVNGYDAISIFGGGCDLGGSSGGSSQFALRFYRCSNINITNHYASSDLSVAASRIAIAFYDCVKFTLSGCRVYTSDIGLYISNALGLDASHIIRGNYFVGNTAQHILIQGSKAVTIGGNKFDDTPDRTGLNFPIVVSDAGNTYLDIEKNDFSGIEYAFGAGQTGSVTATQRWSVPII